MVVDEPAYRTQLIQLLGRGGETPNISSPSAPIKAAVCINLK